MTVRRLDTLAARWAALAPHAVWRVPDGEGPFPTVLLFHGCGGRRAFLDRYMAAMTRRGLAAVSIDSFAPRRWSRARVLATVCTGLELPGHQRAGDVLASLWGVSRDPRADPTRLALAGWSHGGWAIMDLMTMALTRPGEAGVADPGLAEVEGLEGCQAFQVRQAGVTNAGLAERQPAEPGLVRLGFEDGVRDARLGEVEAPESRQALEQGD